MNHSPDMPGMLGCKCILRVPVSMRVVEAGENRGTRLSGPRSAALRPSRRAALLLSTGAGLLLGGAEGCSANDRNDAIMQSLKQLEQTNAVESGEVAYRLRKAQTQLQRSVELAREGQLSGARNLLRDGEEVQSIRGDLRKLGVYLAAVRPTFDRFEGLALTGSLEAYDNAMREVQRGSEIVTAEDVTKDGEMLLLSMKEVIALLDRTPQWAEKLQGFTADMS